MLEKEIESYLRRKIEAEIPGSLCWKFVSPGHDGVPDRIVMLPSGRVVFVELKREGQKRRPRQVACARKMEQAGQVVVGCDSLESADALVAKWSREVSNDL